MSFRKRNVGISGSQRGIDGTIPAVNVKRQLPGIRPSSIDGRLTTSSGTATLDGLLAGHGGLPLGTSLLIEESGTTDFAGALLKFYAAEGLVQGHHVHVVGCPAQWARELPGVAGESDKSGKHQETSEKMKIAWRYERLGQFGADSSTRDRAIPPTGAQVFEPQEGVAPVFCHTFDLTKRLVHPASSQIDFMLLDTNPSRSPFSGVLSKLCSVLAATDPDIVHRVVVPSLLSPSFYPPHASSPQYVLEFQRGLTSLLAKYSGRMTLLQSLPLSLYPRHTGLTRWIEFLNNGVLELAPFPHSADADSQTSRDPSSRDEPPQGLLRIHKVPIFHEIGSGTAPADTDWTFTLSRRKFVIKPFNLPPIEGDTDAQRAENAEKKPKKAEIEF